MDYLFLDTEWADPMASELVSLALVSEDGTRQFYAEIDPLPKTPTDFVRHAVYPLLDRGDVAMQQGALTASLRRFLSAFPAPCILADHSNDLSLVQYVIAGFDLPDAVAQACGPIPRPIVARMLKEGIMQLVLEDYFEAHPDQARRRHHALVDAQALRMAWLALIGRTEAPWSPALARQRASQPGGP